MPFRDVMYSGSFRPSEVDIIQTAYTECCTLLDRCPKTHEARARMAKLVIIEFEAGNRDPYLIAEQVAAAEVKISMSG